MATSLEFVPPRISKRTCGGWLAISAASSLLQIGVTADSEEEARAAFARAFMKWDAILKSERWD